MLDQSATTFCLNPNYSTTRLVTQIVPIIEKKPEDKFETVLFLPEGEGRQGEGGLRTQVYFKQSLPDKPLITVITVVFNGAKHLEETILSVINQTYDNVEYIIIDGGSTDGTLDIMKKYQEAVDYWISEKDRGLYEAMNKGILASTGKYIFFSGTDDQIIQNSLNKIFVELNKITKKTLVVLPVVINKLKTIYPNLDQPIPIPHHQGCLFHLDALKQLALYSLDYKIHSDFELMQRYIKEFDIFYISVPLCNFSKGGKSTSGKNAFQSIKELLSIYFKYGGSWYSKKWLLFILRPSYYYFLSLLK